MSQVQIVYNKAGLREFCLIETQGSLETDSAGGLRGQRDFAEIERQGSTVAMRIGVHRVQGSVVPLKKPLAVLKKRHHLAPDADPADVHYDIEAIITEKMLFKTRPDVVL
ncbi:Chromosome transmission fidelity protein 8 [Coemansia javaensis]|uniref:Chromosome transmission fidelity protein 8 n=1 Tax=Coemansia javaensis TaxID=2761396 RepID=A0A9W8LKC4_9FUNG|nr:Chromosome transmission fidelity protein 8 [Coemansia javaensis]